jgi:hypothetical protein
MMFRRLVVSALTVGPVLVGGACSDYSPAAPTVAAVATDAQFHRSGSLPGSTNGWNSGTNQAALVWCESHGPASASANIGPAGGIIAVGNAKLILPPGALSKTVHVTATQPGGNNTKVSFEPSGLVFKKPAGLVFDVSDCNVSNYTPDVVYINDEGVIVERVDAVYSNYWHQVAAPVKHFSTYALAW